MCNETFWKCGGVEEGWTATVTNRSKEKAAIERRREEEEEGRVVGAQH